MEVGLVGKNVMTYVVGAILVDHYNNPDRSPNLYPTNP